MFSRITRIAVVLSALYTSTHAQTLNGDTILVSKKLSTTVVFPGEIMSQEIDNEKDYNVETSGNTLTIKAANDNPQSPCALILKEGETVTKEERKEGKKATERTHMLILMYADESKKFSRLHDYSTIENLNKRIAYLDQRRSEPQAAAPAAQPTPAEMLAKSSTPPAAQPAAAPAPAPAGKDEGGSSIVSLKDVTFTLGNVTVTTKDFLAKVEKRRNDFESSSSYIGRNGPNFREEMVKVFKLFNNDTSVRIQTQSGKTGKIKNSSVPKYLNDLAGLGYTDVNITHSDIVYISDLQRQIDGTYKCSVATLMRFEAWKDNKKIADVHTKKTQEIKVVVEDVFGLDGKVTANYRVFLSNLTLDQK